MSASKEDIERVVALAKMFGWKLPPELEPTTPNPDKTPAPEA